VQHIEGKERLDLKDAVWPLLTDKQRDSYSAAKPDGPKKFDKWLTGTFAAKRGFTFQPGKTK
jgi:hypothetical protein